MKRTNKDQRRRNQDVLLVLLVLLVIILMGSCIYRKNCNKENQFEEDMIQTEIDFPKIELPEGTSEENSEETLEEASEENSENRKKSNSINPSNPTDPSNPNKPTVPRDPNKPTVPSNPNKPTVPSNPNKPTDPSNPSSKKVLKEEDIIVILPENLEEDGNPKELVVSLADGVTADVSITYEGNTTNGKPIMAGSYIGVVVAVGKGKYEGKVEKRVDFEISKKEEPEKISLKDEDIIVTLPENLEEDGKPKELVVSLADGVTADVSITYEGNTTNGKPIMAGSYIGVVVAVGKGKYEGKVEKRVDFEISKKEEPEKISLKDEDIIVTLPENLTVNGRIKELVVSLADGVTADVSITYEGNTTNGKPIMAGSYIGVVTAVGKGEYEGKVEKRVGFTLYNEGDASNPSYGNPENPDEEPENPSHGNPEETEKPETKPGNPNDEQNQGEQDKNNGNQGTGENNPDDEANQGIGAQKQDGEQSSGNNSEDETNQGVGGQNQDENQGSSGNNPEGENNQGEAKQVNSEPVFVPVQNSNPAPASEPVSIPTPAPVEEKKEDKQSSNPTPATAELPKQQLTEAQQQNDNTAE